MSGNKGMIGPYRLGETLGQGGMGIVSRAEHAVTGERVALKTLRLLDQRMIQSIRREIQVLACVRHPGVIRIIDHGLHEGVPWYAMELLEGMPLKEWRYSLFRPRGPGKGSDVFRIGTGEMSTGNVTEGLPAEAPGLTETLDISTVRSDSEEAASPRVPSPQDQEDHKENGRTIVLTEGRIRAIVDLVRAICDSLSYLHGEGIIHRDLKPDNVLVLKDGSPVIVDFGLFTRAGGEVSREILQVDACTSGTVHYISPEQIRGDFVDARADLYSLGCILYELLLSCPPFGLPFFMSWSPSRVVNCHLCESPRPLSAMYANFPHVLNEVVQRLLEKDPRRRFGYAADVAMALASLGSGRVKSSSQPAARQYLYRPGFCGRESQFTELEQLLTKLQAGQGGLVLLSGESGVGKTRVAMELGRAATRRNIRVILGECQPEKSGPLHALRKPLQVIADQCRAKGPQETARLLGNRGPVLALYEPSLYGLPGPEYSEPEVLPPREAHLRLFSYLVDTLRALVAEKALLMILDDIQWGDALTIDFLAFLAQLDRLADLPLLVVVTCRSEEVPEGQSFETLLGRPGLRKFTIDRLDSAAVSHIVNDMLAIDEPIPQFVDYLHRHSEGNPFFIAEYLRAAVEERLLERDRQGRWHISGLPSENAFDTSLLPLPQSLRKIVSQRVERLSGPVRECAEVAAVIGRECQTTLLQELTRREDREFLDHLAELLRREVMEEIKPGRLRFTHDKIREVIYEILDPGRRETVHRHVAQALERESTSLESGSLARIGFHWEKGREPVLARGYYLKAAKIDVANYAYVRADRMFEKYLSLIAAPDRENVMARIEWVTHCLTNLGRLDEANEQLVRAVDEARLIGDSFLEALSSLRMGDINYLRGDLRTSRSYCQRALTMFQEQNDLQHQAFALERIAILDRCENRFDTARELYCEAIDIYHRTGDHASEGVTTGNLAILLDIQGDIDEADMLYRQTLDLARTSGNKRLEANTASNYAVFLKDRKKYVEGKAFSIRAVEIAREIGWKRVEAISLFNMAAHNFVSGYQPEAFISLAEEALSIAVLIDDHLTRGRILTGMATVTRLLDGNIEKAARLIDQAETLLRKIGQTDQVVLCLCEKGCTTLAGNQSAGDILAELDQYLQSIALPETAELKQKLEMLRRSQNAFERCEPLFRGECPENIADGFREWLHKHGQLVL